MWDIYFLPVGWQESDVSCAVSFFGCCLKFFFFLFFISSKILSLYAIKDANSYFNRGLQSQNYDYFFFLFLPLQSMHMNTQESTVWQEISYSSQH